ncbi:hypothetical protein [Klebsiella quasipneumoniae]|uniref:hypothetical protein n=1 Tax=Klebsiella quasipneumoniae TaxID=1463165 RepID=UPI000E684C08|nr:hypothetical protein [Klebsiella quasipneumoniae]RIY05595.1 hypothetical protein D3X40_23290 [Klebsiella quasipneumoniae]
MNDKPFIERVLANKPAWTDTQIEPWSHVRYRQAEDFITRHYWTDRGSINVFRIVGTDHPQYAGMSWLDLLHRGKRMDINIPLIESNPDFYTEATQSHQGMCFVSLDGLDWYVSADGNHRSYLARFYFHLQGYGVTQLHNVSLSQYQVDHTFMAACEALSAMVSVLRSQGVYLALLACREPISRDDTLGWKVDSWYTEVTVTLDDTNGNDGEQRFVLRHARDAEQLRRQLEIRYLKPGATLEKDPGGSACCPQVRREHE